MKIAIGSDMQSDIVEGLIDYLHKKNIAVDRFGALKPHEQETMWPAVGYNVAKQVADQCYDFGILFCWTGTGVSIAANKVNGVRAALCIDAETARGAKKWNDANILVMSLRLVSAAVGEEIIDAWLSAHFTGDEEDTACLAYLHKIEG